MGEEEELRSIVEANREANRHQWAAEAKARYTAVIGTISPCVPAEIIYAAGFFPWRVTGSQSAVHLADQYRPQWMVPYNTHIVEAQLRGELGFLDGFVAADLDLDTMRGWEVLNHLRPDAFSRLVHVSRQGSEAAIKMTAKQFHRLLLECEQWSGKAIRERDLLGAIQAYNEVRRLIGHLYGLRKRAHPPLTGTEMAGIAAAATIMPPPVFVERLGRLLSYIEQRRTALKRTAPRLMVSGDALDDPAFVALIEDLGTVVAMDDCDPGARNFIREVDTSSGEPIEALARHYRQLPGCPRDFTWPDRVSEILRWTDDWAIDGVVEYSMMYLFSRSFRQPYLAARLREKGKAHLGLTVGYRLGGDAEQLRTRVQAFIEMVSA